MTHNYKFNITHLVTLSNLPETSENVDIMMISSTTIAGVGIIANITVVIAFLSHRKLRRKIPNMCIINQVSETKM